jgi:hypothetical protein
MDEQIEKKLQVTRLLGMYQMVEFSLKIYIASAYTLIRNKLDGAIPFEYRYKDIENAPLGRLNGIFAKLNPNADLQKRLGKLIKHRDYIAHRALVEQHDVIRDVLDIGLEEEPIDLSAAESEVDSCLILLSKELEIILHIESAEKA